MSNNCSQLGYNDAFTQFCVALTINVEADEFTVDKAWIAGAFLLGFVIGGGLTALCVKPFLLSWQKKKVSACMVDFFMFFSLNIQKAKCSTFLKN
jgi:hypothetical protein